jgi:hypothetical protein
MENFLKRVFPLSFCCPKEIPTMGFLPSVVMIRICIFVFRTKDILWGFLIASSAITAIISLEIPEKADSSSVYPKVYRTGKENEQVLFWAINARGQNSKKRRRFRILSRGKVVGFWISKSTQLPHVIEAGPDFSLLNCKSVM